ncbi:RING-H2 finger protein ATL56-like [Phalaenopsis equestris]|uniref:RING-H2 finger protein ATL56-like n=1 Tax=Phalaenopsis equestris TaxID=78828 RepID=UPI0009E4464F|nr:RING-H2 finger protein ATL56-like [Phalaenopsis equestris]
MPNEEDFNESMSLRTTAAVHSPAAKPKGGAARLLSILLRLLVMQTLLTFFFLFAGIAVFILIFLGIAGKVLRHRRRGRRSLFQQPVAERRGLSREEIRRLSCFRCSVSGGSDDCVVCLEGFREGDWCRVLPDCKHSFHRICVDRWLERSKSCPLCRRSVAAG